MADENAVLASKSSAYVTGYLAPLNPPGTKFLISEFLPSNDGLGTGTSVTDGTLYGAIYAAEYVMRMSAAPSMLYVGMHALTGTRGVNAASSHYIDVQNAYNQGTTIDTLTLNFGFFTETQPLAWRVLNGVLRSATQVDSTAVTGGATVPATGIGEIPALYRRQAYTSATGQHSVVVANKSATAQPATLRLNGTVVSGTLPLQYIAGSDPAAVNTAAKPDTVSVETGTSANPVTVPAYSVMRVDLDSPAVASGGRQRKLCRGPVAPQEIVSLFGPGMASQTAITSLPLPTVLGGTSVYITANLRSSSRSPPTGQRAGCRRAWRRVRDGHGVARLDGGSDRVHDHCGFRAGAVQRQRGRSGRSGGQCLLVTHLIRG